MTTKDTDEIVTIATGNDDPAKVARAIALLASGYSCRQIAKVMGKGWSKSKVAAFKNKADVKALVEQASRGLLSRSLLQAIDNQAKKMEIASNIMEQVNRLVIEADELAAKGEEARAKKKQAEARAILKEANGIFKLSDQAEARLLETVGMAPTRLETPTLNFINAPTNQAIISPELITLLGMAQDSNLGKLLGNGQEYEEGEDVTDYLDSR